MKIGSMNSLVSRPIAFFLGVVVALIGDAGHVASGTTQYAASGWPDVLLSPAWFPLVVGASVVLTAQVGRQLGLPSRGRTRAQLGYAALSVLGLYLLTSTLRSLVTVVSVTVVGVFALAVWYAWDRSARCFWVSIACAVLASTAEMALVAGGVYSYADGALFGVAPWLPCLFFAAGAVASGVFGAPASASSVAPDGTRRAPS